MVEDSVRESHFSRRNLDPHDYSGHQRGPRHTTDSDHHNFTGDAASSRAHASAEAGGKLRSEAVGEWFRQSEIARRTPLAVSKDGSYVVGHGDCLSTIAERRLRKDGENVGGKSIDKEVKRLRELNADRFPSLMGHTEKQQNFLADGWKLKLYDGSGAQTHIHRPDPPQNRDKPPAPHPQPDPHYRDKPAPHPQPDTHYRDKPPALHPQSDTHYRDKPAAPNLQNDPRYREMPPAPYPQNDRRYREMPPAPDSQNDRRYGEMPPAPYPQNDHRYGELPPPSYPQPDQNFAPPDNRRQYPGYGERYAPGQQPYGRQPNVIGDILSVPERIVEGVGEGLEAIGKGIENVFRSVNRERFYNNQKHSYDCGPTALGMAIGDRKLGRPPTDAEVNALARATGTGSDGLPDWEHNLPRQLKNNGLNAQSYAFSPGDRNAMNQLDRELAQGHSAIVHVNNPLTGNGHFIYVAGKTANGTYIIGDPNRRGNTLGHDKPISRQHLESMMVMPPRQHPGSYKGTPGFTAVW